MVAPTTANKTGKHPSKATTTTTSQNNKAKKSNAQNNHVRVVARIRPLAPYEIDKGCEKVIRGLPRMTTTTTPTASNSATSTSSSSQQLHVSAPESRYFELDAVLDDDCSQLELYHHSGAQTAIQSELLHGTNCTILAYGQTGAGKTFSMGTASIEPSHNATSTTTQLNDHDGIIPRACVDLFQQLQQHCCVEEENSNEDDTTTTHKKVNYKVELQYMEVYNEEIRDLMTTSELGKPPVALRIRETPDGQVYVRGLRSVPVHSPSDIGTCMAEASSRRMVAATQMNATSSRSHAICVLHVSGTHTQSQTQFQSKLTLVDLAGSERIKKTAASGNRAAEGISINKGLFVLGQVISALAETRGPKYQRKPPYRDSKLTRLLQDSLGGNSHTLMVACVSPADFNVEESVNTLRYATAARNIVNQTISQTKAASMSPEEATRLRRENELLQAQVKELESTIHKLTQDVKGLEDNVKVLEEDLEEARSVDGDDRELIQTLREQRQTTLGTTNASLDDDDKDNDEEYDNEGEINDKNDAWKGNDKNDDDDNTGDHATKDFREIENGDLEAEQASFASAKLVEDLANAGDVDTKEPELSSEDSSPVVSSSTPASQTISSPEHMAIHVPSPRKGDYDDDDESHGSMSISAFGDGEEKTIPESTPTNSPSNNNKKKKKKTYQELEQECKNLHQAILRSQTDLKSMAAQSGVELPSLRKTVQQLQDHLHDSMMLENETEQLRQELKVAKEEAKAATHAADHLNHFVEEQLSQSQLFSGQELDDKRLEYQAVVTNEEWMVFVGQLLASFKEQMRLLGDFFSMVIQIVNNPEVVTSMLPRKPQRARRFSMFGGGGSSELEDKMAALDRKKEEMDLLQKMMSEHVQFFNDKFLEVEDEINTRSDSLESIQDRVSQLKEHLEEELGPAEFMRNMFYGNKGQEILLQLTRALIDEPTAGSAPATTEFS